MLTKKLWILKRIYKWFWSRFFTNKLIFVYIQSNSNIYLFIGIWICCQHKQRAIWLQLTIPNIWSAIQSAITKVILTIRRYIDSGTTTMAGPNGTVHFKNGKLMFEYQHLLLLRDIWWSMFWSIFRCCSFFLRQC